MLMALSIVFICFVVTSLAYSAADKFDRLKSVRNILKPIQLGVAVVLLIFGFVSFFKNDLWHESGDAILLALIFLLAAHWSRWRFLTNSQAIASGHSDLFDTRLAMMSNTAMFIAIFIFIMPSRHATLASSSTIPLVVSLVFSILMIFKECFYLLRYTNGKNKNCISFLQILFGEILKSSAVIFVFSMTVLLSMFEILRILKFDPPQTVTQMTDSDFGALAFCSLIGSTCPDLWQWPPMIWGVNLLAAIGYYVLGIALAAAINRV